MGVKPAANEANIAIRNSNVKPFFAIFAYLFLF
jgi:hypothetical protein